MGYHWNKIYHATALIKASYLRKPTHFPNNYPKGYQVLPTKFLVFSWGKIEVHPLGQLYAGWLQNTRQQQLQYAALVAEYEQSRRGEGG